MVEELSKNGFNDFIKSGVCVVDFFAEWCMPCVMLSPIIEELADKIKGVNIGKVNIDDNKETADKFDVMSVPTLIVFKDGKEIDRMVGVLPAEQLEGKLRSFL